MNEKRRAIRLLLKILLPILCAAWVAFIFSNSLRVGEQSAEQSSIVVGWVQTVAGWFAPNGWIKNASGKDYELLQGVVRKLAHFTEFAALGALAATCYFVYAGNLRRLWIPALAVAVVPFLDEGIQLFIPERAASVIDVLIDLSGALVGFLFALLLWLCIHKIRNRRT